MTYFGIGIDPKIPADSSLEEPSKTGLISGAYESAKESFKTDYLPNQITQFETDMDIVKDGGKWLTSDEYKNSPWARDKNKFPDGVYESQARIASKLADGQEKSDELINNMDNGVIPWLAKNIGSAIGFTVDPVNIATTMFVPELVGADVSKTAFLMSSSKAQFLLKNVAKGMLEGSLIATPSTISEADQQLHMGQTPDALNILMSIGTAAVIGGVVRGAGGVHRILSTDGFNAARESSVSQMANDTVPDVSDIIKQAYNEARDKDSNLKDVPTFSYSDLNDEQKNAVHKHMKEMFPDMSESQYKDTLDSEQFLKANKHIPVDFDEVKANVNSINDYDRDSSTTPGEMDDIKEKIENTPDDFLHDEDDINDRIKELKDDGLLHKEDESIFEEFDKSHNGWTKVAEALREYSKCILGESGE